MDNGRNRTAGLASARASSGSGTPGGPPRRRQRPVGGDQRPASRDRVEPAGVGSGAPPSSSATTLGRQRRSPRERRRPRAALAPRRLRARRAPDRLPGHRELAAQGWKDLEAAATSRRFLRFLGPAVLSRFAAARTSLTTRSDRLVVLDLDTGDETAEWRPSSSQAFLPRTGFERDVYYQSLATPGSYSPESESRDRRRSVPGADAAGTGMTPRGRRT